MIERVLTVRQPWADLVMAGVKDVENRTWPVPSTLPQWRLWQSVPDVPTNDAGRHRYDDRCPMHHCIPDGQFPFRLWIHAAKTHDRAGFGQALSTYLDVVGPTGSIGVLTATAPARRGVLLGPVTLTGCHHADECRETRSAYRPGRGERWESFCSSWADPDAWHWHVEDPEPLAEPIAMRGRQGLWRLPDDVVREVVA